MTSAQVYMMAMGCPVAVLEGALVVLTVSPSVACCPRTPPDERRPVTTDLGGLELENLSTECPGNKVCCLSCHPIEHMFDGRAIERLPDEPDVPAVCRRCNAFFGVKEQATRTSTRRRRRSPACAEFA